MALLSPFFPYPMNAVGGGQAVESGFAQAEREGEQFHSEMRDRLALRKAAAGMGSTNYFTGYDGVEGAERPDYLKELYKTGDPNEAIRMEQLASEPFKIQRSVQTAGAIEAAKRDAITQNMMKMFDHFMPGGMQGADGGGTPDGSVPSGGNVNAAAGPLSGRSAEFGMTPQGPTFKVADMSQVERAAKLNEMKNRDTTAGASIKTADTGVTREDRERVNQAFTHFKQIKDQIAATHKAIQDRDIEPAEGHTRLQELKEAEAAAASEWDNAQRGRPSTPPHHIQSQAPAPGISLPPAAAVTRPPGSLPLPNPSGGGLTYKEQGALAVKDRDEQTTASNKAIADARLGAQKVNKFKKPMKELFDIVNREDIGHPAMESIPGAQNVLSLNRSNAQVKKLNEMLVNMFAEPGQSQMMNTIVERTMQGAQVPGLFTDPQLNKINAANLRSGMEHLTNFPTFLEKWHASHRGSSDGATEAWMDYTDHNPLYSYAKDARGKVTVKENQHVLPVDKWLSMKKNGQVRSVGDRTYIQMPDKSWVEK